LVDHASSSPLTKSAKTSLPLKALIENHFKGTVIEDEGIGACGQLHSLNASVNIPAQAFNGKLGAIEVRESGEWVYFLNEEAMDGELTSPYAQCEESFTLQASVDQNVLPFELKLHLQGTEDIPDIIGASISAVTDNESNNSDSPRKARAEHEIMSMIGELLMTN
jgi:VCBS repeat-containing protein